MEELLKQILEGQNTLIQRMDKLEGEISTIKSDMATKTQQNENSGYIKSLLHRTEEMSAQFHQEAELYELKAVK